MSTTVDVVQRLVLMVERATRLQTRARGNAAAALASAAPQTRQVPAVALAGDLA